MRSPRRVRYPTPNPTPNPSSNPSPEPKPNPYPIPNLNRRLTLTPTLTLTLARTLGTLFTWGFGGCGQLAHGSALYLPYISSASCLYLPASPLYLPGQLAHGSALSLKLPKEVCPTLTLTLALALALSLSSCLRRSLTP